VRFKNVCLISFRETTDVQMMMMMMMIVKM